MKRLANILSNENDEEFIYKFLTELFTKDECAMIEQRLNIVSLLSKGVTQHEIAKQLQASLCSITRGSKIMKEKDSAVLRVVKKYNI